MCGIAGIADFEGREVDKSSVEKMARSISHRGPDGEGYFFDQTPRYSVGLAHRRLAIIDVAGGAQPLANEDGSVQVVFNGEIYNFQELRGRLKGLGHRFQTRSDTEVIVHGYDAFGPQIVDMLDGMFAFALWDRESQRLLLARDRAGKKPLYYRLQGNRLSFASEIKAIAALGGSRADLTQIPAYLVLGSAPGSRTPFVGIEQLPPGHLAVMDASGLTQRRYWDLPTASRAVRHDRYEPRTLGDLIRSAVEKRLISDVPLGALLSGGVDSSLVVSTMRDLREEVHTFTVGLDDSAYDESAHAREVARVLGTRHHELHVTTDAVHLVDKVVDMFDEPFADASALPTYLVSEFARRHVTVVLTGDGGDELFAGYPRLSWVARAERAPRPLARWVGELGRWLGSGGAHDAARARALRLVERSGMPLPDRLLSLVSVFREEELESLLLGALEPVGRAYYAEVDQRFKSGTALDRALFLNYHIYLADDLLRKVDRASMAVGLEARSPLLDTALTEYAFALPDDAKVRGRRLKHGLRELAEKRVPKSILDRPKQGFGLPLSRWFRESLAELAKSAIYDARGPLRAFFKPKALAHLFELNASRQRDTGMELWALLVLDRWLRKFAPELVGTTLS